MAGDPKIGGGLQMRNLSPSQKGAMTYSYHREWNTESDLRLHLDGLNAQIFEYLVEGGGWEFFHGEQEENNCVPIRDLLAQALATSDRGSVEQASRALAESLWLKLRRSGIGYFMRLLAERQWNDVKWPGYRDHLCHTIKTYLLGLVVLGLSGDLRDALCSACEVNGAELHRMWVYASTFHDVGYIFELADRARFAENMKFIEEYTHHYFHYYDEEMTSLLIEQGLSSQTITKNHARRILDAINVTRGDCTGLDDLAQLWNAPEDLWSGLNQICEASGIGQTGISKYFQMCSSGIPSMANERMPFHDHGVLGALLLARTLRMQSYLFDQLEVVLKDQQSDSFQRLQATGRKDVLKAMLGFWRETEDREETINQAVAAIALHRSEEHTSELQSH